MLQSYSSYVWTCYAVTAMVLVLNIWLAHRSHRKELEANRRRRETKSERTL
jgi:heme exporter protein CcmD